MLNKKLFLISHKFFRAIYIMALFSLLLSNFSNAQKDIDKIISSGLNNMYSFKWNNAQNDFNKLIAKYPDDPRGYHFLSNIYMWYYLSNNDNSDYIKFINYSDSTLAISEKLMSDTENENLLLVAGTNYVYRSVVFNKAQKHLDAVWAIKKAESNLSKVIDINKDNYDAFFGLGIYNFAIGQIPAAFRWALSVAGVKGDKNTGIKFISLAAQHGNYTKIEAQYYLSQVYSENLLDFSTSSNYLQGLLKKYPDNKLFNYAYAVLKVKQKDLIGAQTILNKLTEGYDEKFNQLYAYSNFLLGDVHFKRNEFDSAKYFYVTFLNNIKDKNYVGIASYRAALCYDITGDEDNALLYYGNSNKGNSDLDDDIYANRKGSYYFKNSLSKVEEKVIIFSNYIESSKYLIAVDSLTFLLDSTTTEKHKAEISYYLSEGYYYLGNYDKSLEYALLINNYNIEDETWLKPFACYNAARIYKIKTDFFEMKDKIDEASKYTNYDYQNKLKNSLESLKKVNF